MTEIPYKRTGSFTHIHSEHQDESDDYTVFFFQCSFAYSVKKAPEVRVSTHALLLVNSFALLAPFNHNTKVDMIKCVIILDREETTLFVWIYKPATIVDAHI